MIPWSKEEGWRGWELSQVSVPHSFAAASAPADDPSLSEALAQAHKLLGRRLGHGIIVPLAKGDDGIWRGQLLNGKDNIGEVSYHPNLGLTIQ